MATGKVVLKLDNDISTDIIYPGRFMATVLPTETPQFAFADNTAFNQALTESQVPEGSFIVAGDNFGCGLLGSALDARTRPWARGEHDVVDT